MCLCEVIPIHYDDFVLLVRCCAVIQHTAEHVVTFLCLFYFFVCLFLFCLFAFNKSKHGLILYVVLLINNKGKDTSVIPSKVKFALIIIYLINREMFTAQISKMS